MKGKTLGGVPPYVSPLWHDGTKVGRMKYKYLNNSALWVWWRFSLNVGDENINCSIMII